VAAGVIIAIVAVLLIVRAGRGSGSGDSVAGGSAATTPSAADYRAPVYTLCGDDVPEAAVAEGGPPVIGEPPPDFALCDANGVFVTRLSDMKDKVVWLNFWATWCVPCKKELPGIQRLYDENRAGGLAVLIINYKEPEATALEFLTQLGISLPLLLDSRGEIYDSYRLTGLPGSFFVDREGKLAALYYGYLNEEIARERLADAGLE
jgi:thiol-disulfide isomerase/thioredoxin